MLEILLFARDSILATNETLPLSFLKRGYAQDEASFMVVMTTLEKGQL